MRVCFDQAEGWIKRRFDRDLLADDSSEHGPQVGHQMIQVDQLGLQHLSATEGEQLFRKYARSICSIQNLFQLVSFCISGRWVVQQHLRIAADDGKQIVEIVSDASSQPSYGLHLVSLTEAFF